MRKWIGRHPGLCLAVGLFLFGGLAGALLGERDQGRSGEGERLGEGPATVPGGGERALFAAALGGYRSLVGNLSWLRVYEAWEARQAELVRERIRQTVTLCPEESFFWREGARILAYDLPVWRAERASGPVTIAEWQRWQREAAREALALLAEGRVDRPRDPSLPGEIGRLHWLRLEDPGRAVRWLAEAERLAGGGDPRYRRWRMLAEIEAGSRGRFGKGSGPEGIAP